MTVEKKPPKPIESIGAADSFFHWQEHLGVDTRSSTNVLSNTKELEIPGLTILWHTNPFRIGETMAFSRLSKQEPVLLSRLEPNFKSIEDGQSRPLADPHMSRKPIKFIPVENGALKIDLEDSTTALEANNIPVETQITFEKKDLKQGVVLLVAKRIALLLHLMEPPAREPMDLGLVGQSRAIIRVKREILKVAGLSNPVLLKGESGTGKELVARAIHQIGSRRDKPFFSINMGAIPPNLAASELFGAKKGSYSGADINRLGFFQRADTGTLLLDEIGVTSQEIQVMLLRALETGEIQQVGAEKPQKVDVRVVAATDVDLEEAVENGAFKAPLLHRLATFEIRMPPLRERREDIGRLLINFIQNELEMCSEKKLLDPGPYGKPWLPAELVSRLAVNDWPGNVRQLRNVARQLVINSQGHSEAQIDERIERLAGAASQAKRGQQSKTDTKLKSKFGRGEASYREPWQVHEDELLKALRENRWNLKRAADMLGISRPSLYALIDACPKVRKAGDLTREEIESAIERCVGNIEAMVDSLKVSKRGLKMRMKELGMR
jgi:two-component system nitrogen regulation response regulator GlnG